LRSALERWRVAAQKLQGPRLRLQGSPAPMATMAQESGAAMAAKAGSADASAEGITNVQTQGVDEGGIVKQAGEHLVILRRGRLFTVRVGGDELRPLAMLDAYAPGSDPRGAWYDELLVSGSTVVVVGYSYARGGTEIGLFELARDGTLSYKATYHLRSFDYYSSRNYASRLLDGKLIFYAPTLLQPWGPSPLGLFPAARRWGGVDREVPASFERILPATRVFRTDDDFDPTMPLALHTVTQCALGGASLRCEASAVLAPAGRVFYVSAGSVYVWTTGMPRWHGGLRSAAGQPQSALFRLPLDGSAPSAIKTAGVPVDQMSFLEDREGHLSVLLREAGDGEGLWAAERHPGRMALLRLPLSALGDGRNTAPLAWYRRLPGPVRSAVQNRHIGDWLIWGGEDGAWALQPSARDAEAVLVPGHAVNASRPWVNTRCWLAGPAASCASVPCACSEVVPPWPAAMGCPMRGRVRRARTASSTVPPAAKRACSGCPCCPARACRAPSGAAPRCASPFCATTAWASPPWANWPQRLPRSRTTAARRPASTGTAMHGPSSWVRAFWR
jgi:hypothetical protein